MKSLLTEYSQQTTFHGFRQIGDDTNPKAKRLFWLFLVMGMTSGLLLYLRDTYISQNQHTVLTVTQTEQRETIPFPAVTICNRGHYSNQSGYISKDLQTYLNDITTDSFNWNSPAGRNIRNLSSAEVEEQVGFNWTSMIENPRFGHIPLNISDEDVFATKQTAYGRCILINGPKSIKKRGRFEVSRAGRRSALFMHLNTQQYHYIHINEQDYGFEVYIHEPDDFPDPEAGGILLSPGTYSAIVIKPIQYKLLPYPYKSYQGGYCVENNSERIQKINKLYQMVEYSRSTCLANCIANYSVQECGCNTPTHNDQELFVKRRNCTLYEITSCYIPVYTKYIKKAGICDCPRPCHYVTYETQLSHSLYPSDPAIEYLQEERSSRITKSIARDSLLKVSIYYKDMFYHEIKHVPEAADVFGHDRLYWWLHESDAGYTVGITTGTSVMTPYITCRVGGLMGLFLGASLVSVVELVLVLLKLVWTFLSKLKNRLFNRQIINVKPVDGNKH